MNKYYIPYQYRNGKKTRWLDIYAKNIIEAVEEAHAKLKPLRHEIILMKIRRG